MDKFMFHEFLQGRASQEDAIDAMKITDKIVAKRAECSRCRKRKAE